jgi:hypothetical protein
MKRFIFCVWLAVAAINTFAQGVTWQDALARMPLPAPQNGITDLTRTNCVTLMLDSFQSNSVVKAIVFMPGSTDELYFFRRAHATMTNAAPTLLDAVTALTNQTYIRATFVQPLLLLHTTEDSLDGFATIKNESTAEKLRGKIMADRIELSDADWDAARSKLNWKLSIGLRPLPGAAETWHFYRHNIAACGVSQFEMLEVLALAGKTTFTLNWRTAVYQPDSRSGDVPKLQYFPSH